MFQAKFVQKIKTRFMFNNFFLKNLTVYEIVWKNIVEPSNPRMVIEYCACAFHAGYLNLQTHTQIMQYFITFPLCK
jgi:hypothetical protein